MVAVELTPTPPRHLIISFNPSDWPFADCAKKALRIDDLDQLHLRPDILTTSSKYAVMEVCGKQVADSFVQWRPMFRSFFESVVGPVFGHPNTYQIPPVFRVHLSGGPPASLFHRDRDHGVSPDRLNLWLPLTDVSGSNTLLIEPEANVGKFWPVNLNYGEAIVFDGANLLHGSTSNQTKTTRISMDCRFFPLSRTAFDER